MAQEGYDTLMALTDSRYRLSMIVARRAAQLKSGIPSILDVDDLPHTTNTVSIAMKELETTSAVHWGDDLPPMEELRKLAEPTRRSEEPTFSVARSDPADEI